MATPMTPDQALNAFRKEGLTVVEIPGWRTNDRGPATGRPSGPKHGLVNHHTGGDTSNPYGYAAGLLSRGSTALVGPLCHQGLDPDKGTLYMVGTGRTNHAGGGDPAVLAAVKNETVPYDRELKPSKGNLNGVDGNAPFYGLEVMYSGSRDVPRVGYVAMVRWNTAICRFHGWTGASAIAHREWSSDKPDPGRVNLPQLRRDIDAALAQPPGAWGTSTTPPPKPQPEPTRIEPAMRIIRSKDTGACYEVGPNLCQHIPTIERLHALEKTWGPLVDMSQAEVQAVWGQTVDDINATKSNFGLPLVPPADPPVAERSLGEAIDDAAPDCAEPSRHNV